VNDDAIFSFLKLDIVPGCKLISTRTD